LWRCTGTAEGLASPGERLRRSVSCCRSTRASCCTPKMPAAGSTRGRLVENAPVMDQVWTLAAGESFARRRIIDACLARTLQHHGATELATVNTPTPPSTRFPPTRVFAAMSARPGGASVGGAHSQPRRGSPCSRRCHVTARIASCSAWRRMERHAAHGQHHRREPPGVHRAGGDLEHEA